MIEDDGGFMRRETQPEPLDYEPAQCEECDKLFNHDDVVFDSEMRGFCSEECKEENIMWRCEMREIAKHEREYD